MEIEVKIIGRKAIAAKDRSTIMVETQDRRGDGFIVQRADPVMENDTATFKVADGGRLVITTPEGGNEVVYDREQGAAIRLDAQDDATGHADKPSAIIEIKPIDAPLGKAHTTTGVPVGAAKPFVSHTPQTPNRKV